MKSGFVVFFLQGDCEWTRHRKQGVYFFRSPWESPGDGRTAVSYSFTFEPSLGDIKMDFGQCTSVTDWRSVTSAQLLCFTGYLTILITVATMTEVTVCLFMMHHPKMSYMTNILRVCVQRDKQVWVYRKSCQIKPNVVAVVFFTFI